MYRFNHFLIDYHRIIAAFHSKLICLEVFGILFSKRIHCHALFTVPPTTVVIRGEILSTLFLNIFDLKSWIYIVHVSLHRLFSVVIRFESSICLFNYIFYF